MRWWQNLPRGSLKTPVLPSVRTVAINSFRKFKSDFRVVADYLVQKRMNNDYVPSREELRHVDEVLKLMSVVNGDKRFEMVQKDLHKEGLTYYA